MANMRSKSVQAPDARGRQISQAHHLDSVVYNEAHALRHIQEAEKHAKKLEPASKKETGVKAELRRLDATKKRLNSKALNGTSKRTGNKDAG